LRKEVLSRNLVRRSTAWWWSRLIASWWSSSVETSLLDHRLVLPASVFLGAGFLAVCVVRARTLMAPMELPVGIITTMLGGPFFAWMLLRTQ